MRLERERHTLGEVLRDHRVLLFAALYFTMVVNVYGLSFWVGEVVDQIKGVGDVGKGFITAAPYAFAIIGMVLIPRYSDRSGERKRVLSVCLITAAAAFVISTVVGPVAAVAALGVGLFFLLGAHGVFWTMPAALLSGAAAAAGIALINSIGNIGGFVGPYLVGAGQGRDGLHRRRPGHAGDHPGGRQRPRPARGARAGAGTRTRAHRALRSHQDGRPRAGRHVTFARRIRSRHRERIAALTVTGSSCSA